MSGHTRCYRKCLRIVALLLSTTAPVICAHAAQAVEKPVQSRGLDAATVQGLNHILGRSGTLKEGVYKVAFPRSDLKVRVDGVEIKPGLALGSWAAFKTAGEHTMLMGDLVLLENEINPVLSRLEANGIEVSALHNHVLHETPQVMYLHIMGHGDPQQLARGLKDALALSATPLGKPAAAQESKAGNGHWQRIEAVLGRKGTEKGGVLQFSVPRQEKISMADGSVIPPFMGTATAINFQKSPKGVATTGDFVLVAREVNPVIRALRKAGMQVTALHSHMLDDKPRLFFMHFWGNGDPAKLAGGLREALKQTNSAPPAVSAN